MKSLEEMNYASWVEILSEKVGGGTDLFLLERLAQCSKKALFAIKSFLVFTGGIIGGRGVSSLPHHGDMSQGGLCDACHFPRLHFLTSLNMI